MRNLRALAIVAVLGINGCSSSSSDWMTSPFPEGIELGSIRASCSEAGWTEGSSIVVVDLPAQTADRLASERFAFLSTQTHGRGGQILSAWKVTPVVQAQPNDAKLRDRCGSMSPPTIDNAMYREFADAVERGEAYYATFNDREGLIILAPRLRLAAYYYYG